MGIGFSFGRFSWFIADLWGAAMVTRASSSGPISRICRRPEAKACQTRMVWLPSTRIFPQIRDEPFSSNSFDRRLDSGSPQAPPGMTVLVGRRCNQNPIRDFSSTTMRGEQHGNCVFLQTTARMGGLFVQPGPSPSKISRIFAASCRLKKGLWIKAIPSSKTPCSAITLSV